MRLIVPVASSCSLRVVSSDSPARAAERRTENQLTATAREAVRWLEDVQPGTMSSRPALSL